jgi:hypothetical protein
MTDNQLEELIRVDGPSYLGTLISDEVTRAELDYQNFRSRALNVVTTAGGIVTLITGLLAIAIGTTAVVVTYECKVLLIVALVLLLVSACLALGINLPQRVQAAHEGELATFVKREWGHRGWEQRTAEFLVTYLASLRSDNKHSSRLLKFSIGAEILGLVFLAAAAVTILDSAGHTVPQPTATVVRVTLTPKGSTAVQSLCNSPHRGSLVGDMPLHPSGPDDLLVITPIGQQPCAGIQLRLTLAEVLGVSSVT